MPVPCCFPTCHVNTYAYVDGEQVTPLPRLLKIDAYLDYITWDIGYSWQQKADKFEGN